MTRTVNFAEAKAKLSAPVDRAAAGEEIVLSRAGRPVARLMPLGEQTPRRPGLLKQWRIPDDRFLEPMEEEDLRAAAGGPTRTSTASRTPDRYELLLDRHALIWLLTFDHAIAAGRLPGPHRDP